MRCARLLLPLLALAVPAAAQQIEGVVGDVSSLERLPGTLLVALDGKEAVRATALTDSLGAFQLSVPPGEPLRLVVQRVGYAPQSAGPLTLMGPDTLRLTIGLRPEPVELEGLTVVGRTNRNLERFLRSQRRGFGAYLDPTQVARIDAGTASQLLVRMPGSFLFPAGNGGIVTPRRDHTGMCTPRTFVDGSLVQGVPVDSYVSADAVRAVEVYRNPLNAPPEFQRSFQDACPIVVIWTSFGFGFEEGR